MSEAAFPNLHVSHHPLTQHKVTHLREERTDGKTFRELVRELTGLEEKLPVLSREIERPYGMLF